MARLPPRLLGRLAAWVVAGWRATLRIRVIDDPRPRLQAAGQRYVYAILHAQQLSFILLSDDVPIQAMVSASRDGDWLVALCQARQIVPVRGSTRKNRTDKGGRAALAELADGVRAGRPALLAVDGPRGPRNTVHWGVVDLALETDACILVAGIFPSKPPYILARSWDRTQLPRPFSTLVGRFRPPINPRDFPDRATLRAHVAAELLALEQTFDPGEAQFAGRVPPTKSTAGGTHPSLPRSTETVSH